MPSSAYHTLERLARKMEFSKDFERIATGAASRLDPEFAKGETPPVRITRKFDVEIRQIDGTSVYVFRSRTTAPKRRCLFTHGGGGMVQASQWHYVFATRLILQTRAEVWIPFYPLAPGSNFHDSLAACFATYETMLNLGNQLPIYLAGDSAGANLSLAVTRQAIDRGLEPPACVVAISPVTGWEAPHAQESFHAQVERYHDPMLSEAIVNGIRDNWLNGVPLDLPIANPGFMDYTGFPPVQVFYGTAEIFYPFTEMILERMREAEIEVDEHRGEELMHDWAMLNLYPEGAAAQCDIKRFVLKH